MDTVLIILGVLGLGALLIAAYVFTVAARNYVSDSKHPEAPANESAASNAVVRSEVNRRQQDNSAPFPITVNGVLVDEERRELPERRSTS